MSAPQAPLCIDCAHHELTYGSAPMCWREVGDVSPVDGSQAQLGQVCIVERMMGGCGPAGRFFEALPPEPEPQPKPPTLWQRIASFLRPSNNGGGERGRG